VTIEVKIEAETPEEFKEVVKTLFGHLIEGQAVTQVTNKEQERETVQEHHAKLAKKTKEAMTEKKKNMQVWTSALYGWNEKDGLFVPNWEEQDVIAKMKRLADAGTKPAKIADKLNKKGIRGKKGGLWSRNQVLRTIEQPFHSNLNKFTRPAKPEKAKPKPKPKPTKAWDDDTKSMNKNIVETATLTKLRRKYSKLNTPFGWRTDVNGLIYPDEKEQQIIAQWMADVVRTSYHEVAKKATKKKTSTQRIKNKKWKGPEIKRILDNPIHLHYASARAKSISLDEYIAALNPKRVISKSKKKDKSQDAVNYSKRLKRKKEKKKSKAKKTNKVDVRDARPVSLEDLPTAIETVTERKPTFGAAQKFNQWLPKNLRLKLADQSQFILASKLIEAHLVEEGIPPSELAKTRLLLSPEYLTCVKMYFNMYDTQSPGLFTCNPYEDDCLLMVHNVTKAGNLPELNRIE
jgi:hypothetical protein